MDGDGEDRMTDADGAQSRRILRVFPRRTSGTPDDAMVRVATTPGWFDAADEVHISVAFTWDIPAAERLEREWRHVAPTTVGGPALGDRGDEFVPGMYLRHGYTITSRGCPNRCWFCDVPRREGGIRELPIRPGWNVLDSNLLACSEAHIRAVVAMLSSQGRRAEFTGGLEAARLREWHCSLLASLKPRPVVFLAFDEPSDLEPLRVACAMLLAAGWTRESHRLRAYVLCGYPGDTVSAAEDRCREVLELGATPMAMVYRDATGRYPDGWHHMQRRWARPAIIHARQEATT